MKEENCFACDKKTKRKKRSRHLETLSRVERDDEKSATKTETSYEEKISVLSCE